MWLINTTTLQLEYILNYEAVEYAILSHTWEEEEVSFQEFQDLDSAWTKKGFAKIEQTCLLAKQQGFHYAWVDTCCIDKSSSAELSEAINSMFSWYRGSGRCYAYLSDFSGDQVNDEAFGKCRWFTRGWTLQELIAPEDLTFYNADWKLIGAKRNISSELSEINGIDRDVLDGLRHLNDVPIAERMSWAAGRSTSRPEDTAYCLFGIFSVNMPMLYGEGNKAFQRLQDEICKRLTDLTLFAWKVEDESDSTGLPTYPGIFARRPDDFAWVSGRLGLYLRQWSMFNGEIRVTNRGVRFDDLVLSIIEGQGVFMKLGCMFSLFGSGERYWVGIFLQKTRGGYVRTRPESVLWAMSSRRRMIPLPPEQVTIPAYPDLGKISSWSKSTKVRTSDKIWVERTCPTDFWDPYKREFLWRGSGDAGLVELLVGPASGGDSVPLILGVFNLHEEVQSCLVDVRWRHWSEAMVALGKPLLSAHLEHKFMQSFECSWAGEECISTHQGVDIMVETKEDYRDEYGMYITTATVTVSLDEGRTVEGPSVRKPALQIQAFS
ncbi:hypothetical protein ACJ41O_000486 [Fusarium nematophilum]